VGFLTAPLSFEFVQGWYGRLPDLDWTRVNVFLEGMEQQGRAMLAAAGVRDTEVDVTRSCDMRYEGQGSEVTVTVAGGTLAADGVDTLRRHFEERYRDLYGRTVAGSGLETVNWHVVVRGPRPTLTIAAAESGTVSPGAAQKGTRPAYFGELGDFAETPVFDRYRLGPGAVIEGPAIVEERESTVVVGPGTRARVDGSMNVIVELARPRAEGITTSGKGHERC
jgi:N-methylhydantoinase A